MRVDAPAGAPRPDPHGLAPRRAALAMLAAVLDEGRALDAAKAAPEVQRLSPPERARAGDLAATVLRRLPAIDAALAERMRKPLAPRARVARDALRIAIAEVGAHGTPAHAAVDAAVRLAKEDRVSRSLAGLVNAVLRQAAPEAEARLAEAAPDAPAWLRRRLERAWERAAPAILAAHLVDPPLDLTPREPADAALWAERLGAERLPTGSLRLRRFGRIADLPGYAEGAWWPQDAAAAIPARLFGDLKDRRALDLCAAPGGKTLQMAAAGARATALDVSAARLERLRENLARMRLEAEIVTADALEWRPEAPFDAVLLDAPCTGTGVIRRHPDLPYLKRESDVATLAALQDRMLDAAWDMVAPHGTLVFCTCSLLPEEGEARAAAFLARTPEAEAARLAAEEVGDPALLSHAGWFRARPDFWAERGGIDGFFAGRFRRAG